MWACAAYPNGVPEDILNGILHDKIRKDQIGTLVFKYDPWACLKGGG